MNKYLFFARDPAGANVIAPVIKRMEKDNSIVEVYAKDYAIERLKSEKIHCIDILECMPEASYNNICDFLKIHCPDIVVTGTSLDDYTERYIWKAANALGIKSFAILDQWILPGIRFSDYNYTSIDEYNKNKKHVYLPDKILIMDDIVKDMLLVDGIDELKLKIVGQPHFEVIKEKYEKADTIRYQSGNYNILFASEPKTEDGEVEYLGYSECTIFESYYEALLEISEQYDTSFNLIIRPHPRESIEYWNSLIEKRKQKGIILSVDNIHDSFCLMKSVDLVCGMSSMFLVESAICEVPFISSLIGLKHESPFVFDKIDVYNSCRTKKELKLRLKRIIIDKEYDSIKINIIKNASQNVLDCIEEEMNG